jgi:heme O synthase-like polyprenyltransferase
MCGRVSFLQRVRETLAMYSELGKIKLGSMVVITTMAGYYMAPYSSFDLKRFVSHVFRPPCRRVRVDRVSLPWNGDCV